MLELENQTFPVLMSDLLPVMSTDAATVVWQLERRASNRKVADPWFDSRTGNASMGEALRLFPFGKRAKKSIHCGGSA